MARGDGVASSYRRALIKICGRSWTDQQTAPRVPRAFAAIALYILLVNNKDIEVMENMS